MDQVEKYKEKILNLTEGLDITFIPLIKDKALLMGYLKRAKLFIFPSLFEAMSNMLLETASMKCPIICSDISANKSVFNVEEVSFFESNKSDSLAEVLLTSISSYSDMLVKADRAYLKLSSDYTWKQISEQYSELYKNNMGQ